MNQNPKVGITVDAKVDRSVGRAFNETAKKVRGTADEEKKFDRAVGRANESLQKQDRGLKSAAEGAKKYSRDVGDATRKNTLLSRSMNQVGKGLDGMLNKWTGLATGVAGVGSAIATLSNDERLVRLGIQANKSQQEMDALKQTIFETSQLPGVKADPGQLLFAIEKIVEKTGDLDLAKQNILNIGLAMQATGAEGVDIGGMISDMSEKFDIKNSDGMKKMLDTLILQGKAGAFTLQHLAKEGEAVTASYARMGRSGPDAIREMGALLQMAKKGAGSPAEAATAYESVLEDLVSNQDKVSNLGVDLWDPEQLAKGKEVARSIPQVLKEIMIATGGNISEYSDIFGEEALKGVSMIAAEYQKTGGFKMLDSFLQIQGDGAQLVKDSATAANSAAVSYRNLYNVWKDIADGAFSGPMQGMADALNSIDKDTLKTLVQVGAAGVVALGTAALGRKAWKVGTGIKDFIRGGAATGGRRGVVGGLASAAGVTPVFVTNMGMGGMGGDYGGLGGGKGMRSAGRKGLLARGGSMLRAVGKRALPISLLLGSLSIGSTLLDDEMSADDKTRAVSRDVGGMGGAAAGALAGAAIGSVVPVIGTAIGGLIGGILGGMGGEAIGGWVGDKIAPEDAYRKAVQHAGRSRSNAGRAAGNTTISAQINVKSTDPRQAAIEVREQMEAMRAAGNRDADMAFGDS